MKADRIPGRRAAVLGLVALTMLSVGGCSWGRAATPVAQASAPVADPTTAESTGAPEPTDSPTPADPSLDESATATPSDTPSSGAAPDTGVVTYLSSMVPVKDAGNMDAGAFEISGKLYSSSVRTSVSKYSDGPPDSDFLLARTCTRLTATLGMDDQQKDTTPAVASVLVDGKVAFTKKIVYGTATPLSLDVTNALRITVRTQWLASEDGNADAYVVWGDAGVQCTGDLPTPDADS